MLFMMLTTTDLKVSKSSSNEREMDLDYPVRKVFLERDVAVDLFIYLF